MAVADYRSNDEVLVDRLADRIDRAFFRLTEAVKEKRTLVPLVIMVPADIRSDQASAMMKFIAQELRNAGLMEKEGE